MPPSATAPTTPATLPTFSSPSTAPGIFGASPARCLAYRVQLDRSPFAVVVPHGDSSAKLEGRTYCPL